MSASTPDDRRLVELEEIIMAEHRLATQHDDEIWRLQAVWKNEYSRLLNELHVVAASEFRLATEQEREAVWEKVKELSEANEQSRLSGLVEPHWARTQALTEEMWAIPAQTSRGRSAKLKVLLVTVMPGTWLDPDTDVNYDEGLARQLLLEFAGHEAAKPWKEQFAALDGGQA
jgi:hypothetical protein